MFLKKLHLYHFRNYRECFFSVPQRSLIVGNNGEGKTNILEALCLLFQGQSFRANEGSESFVQRGWKGGHIEGEVERGKTSHRVGLHLSLCAGNQFFWDKKPTTASRVSRQMALILFSPESLNLLKGGAKGRRDWMDQWLKMTGLGKKVRDFHRLFVQKNRLLKQLKAGKVQKSQGMTLLKSLNVLFVQNWLALSRARKQALQDLEGLFYDRAFKLLKRQHQVPGLKDLKIQYLRQTAGLPGGGEESLKTLLREKEADEVERGVCLYGAHREDFEILFRNGTARYYCSQGEQRALLLALKQAQIQWLCTFQNRPSLLLLDDVFSEIDKHLVFNLLNFTWELPSQTIWTSTHIPDFLDRGLFTVFTLKNGVLLKEKNSGTGKSPFPPSPGL